LPPWVTNPVQWKTTLTTLLETHGENAAAYQMTIHSLLKFSHPAQVTNPVQWETTLKTLLEKGLTQSYEIGPNKVIAGIMKRIDKTSPVTNITA